MAVDLQADRGDKPVAQRNSEAVVQAGVKRVAEGVHGQEVAILGTSLQLQVPADRQGE